MCAVCAASRCMLLLPHEDPEFAPSRVGLIYTTGTCMLDPLLRCKIDNILSFWWQDQSDISWVLSQSRGSLSAESLCVEVKLVSGLLSVLWFYRDRYVIAVSLYVYNLARDIKWFQMGCGASTPVKEDAKGKPTSAKKHQESRTQDSSQRGPTLNAGPHYKQMKHLGTCISLRVWCISWSCQVRWCHWGLLAEGQSSWVTGIWARRFARTWISSTIDFFNVNVSMAAGKGGTGDTWAFKDTRSGEVMAIKFLKRPLPKVLVENIKREFTVSVHFCYLI